MKPAPLGKESLSYTTVDMPSDIVIIPVAPLAPAQHPSETWSAQHPADLAPAAVWETPVRMPQSRAAHIDTGDQAQVGGNIKSNRIKSRQVKYVCLAKPGVIEADFHVAWPSRGLSCGIPVLCKQGTGGAQHAIQHTKPHPGQLRWVVTLWRFFFQQSYAFGQGSSCVHPLPATVWALPVHEHHGKPALN